jgi:hypothetical protein
MSIRHRLVAAAVGVGALGVAGPVAVANAQTTTGVPPVVTAAPVLPAPTLPAPFAIGLQAAQSGWQQGLTAAEGGWAAGAQAAQAGFAAGAAALGLPAPVAPGIL